MFDFFFAEGEGQGAGNKKKKNNTRRWPVAALSMATCPLTLSRAQDFPSVLVRVNKIACHALKLKTMHALPRPRMTVSVWSVDG